MPDVRTDPPTPPFIQHLYDLGARDNRGALAALRRSLVSDHAALAYPYVLPWLSGEGGRRREDAALLVAGLFALHSGSSRSPMPQTDAADLGSVMRRVWDASKGADGERSRSIEQRFVALLDAHHDDLPYHLRQAVSLVQSTVVPLDWVRLYRDLCAWDHPDRFVQRSWARSFWGRMDERASDPQEEE